MNDFSENDGSLYQNFEDVLAESDCEISASEFQGVLAGMFSAGLKLADQQWKSTLLEIVNEGRALSAEALKAAQDIFNKTGKVFIEEDVLAPILLPDDSYPVIDRLEAIVLWSQGFLLGFGLQQADKLINSPEVAESLQDISKIAQCEVSADESEESQLDVEMLIEHIKVAVKVIYLELVVKNQQLDVASMGDSDTCH